jgi:SAM-dependent methyltransferase
MGFSQSVRKLCYSLALHTGLRNWRLVRWSRSRVAAIVAPGDFRAAQRKWLSDSAASSQEKAVLERISIRIHDDDEMYLPFDAGQYLSVGLSALRCIETALQKSNGKPPVKSILDLPCGYGRVLRFLRARFPDADITASELNQSALEFCKDTFSVKTIASNTDFRKLSVPGRFDLIWCGSLLTHVDESSAAALLKFFHEHLSPGGKCVFTTHGKFVVDRIRNTRTPYGLNEPARDKLLTQFDARGYGYADYANSPGYGVSIVTTERMIQIARSIGPWKDVSCLERGWDNHQDVYIGELA